MTQSDFLRRTRIFIGSPNDLIDERTLFPKVIERINEIKAKSMGRLLEAVGWEDTLPGKGRPQEKINQDLIRCDLIIMLLWKRWGSSTGNYSSGFEEEFFVAEKNGKDIMFYFRSIPDEMLADPGQQLSKVLEFRSNVETGKKYLFRGYEDDKNWEELFIKDISNWLDKLPKHDSPEYELIDEKLKEYQQRIKELEENIRAEQIKSALRFAYEAQEFANLGYISKTEEFFAKAISIYPDPKIISSYGNFLINIGTLKKAEEKFLYLIQLEKIINEKDMIADAFSNLGTIYLSQQNLELSEEMYQKSIALYDKIDNKKELAEQYSNMGNLLMAKDDFDAAKLFYEKSMILNQEIGNRDGIASQYGKLGNLYLKTGKSELADKMIRESLKGGSLKEEAVAIKYSNLGKYYMENGEFNKAEEMYLRALNINIKLNRKNEIAAHYCNLGNLYLYMGDHTRAKEMFISALDINLEIDFKEGVATQYYNLGNLYLNMGDHIESKKMFKQSIATFSSIGRDDMVRNIEPLMKIFIKKGKKSKPMP